MEPLRTSRRRDRLTPGQRPAKRSVDVAPLTGTWVNFDPRSTGLVRVEVAQRAGALAVRAFGADPAGADLPCDWGEITGDAFTDGIGLGTAVAFTALYDFGFALVRLAAYLNKRLLVIDAYSAFHDGSGRSPYFQRDHFYLA